MTPDDAGREIARGFAAGLGDQSPVVAHMMDRIAKGMIRVHSKPIVGDTVHYVSHGTPVRADGTQAFESQCRAVIVTEVYNADLHGEATMYVNVAVLNPTGMFFPQAVPFEDARGLVYEGDADAGPQPVLRTGGTWHWPERA